jgi:hypothetical protein
MATETPAQARPEYRLYLDESGDHTCCHQEDIGKRYLTLAGVCFERGSAYEAFRNDLEEFKRRHLAYDPDDPPILHREDIVQRRYAFWVLRDQARREAFDRELLDLVRATPFRLIVVVLDKFEHLQKKYRSLRHPYHYCLQGMLERYCGWLSYVGRRGDVMAEARGGTEDRTLAEAYARTYERGKHFLRRDTARATLTSKQLKLKPKRANIAGLQLADVLAHPLTRDVLVAYRRLPDRGSPFAEQMAEAVTAKYNRRVWMSVVNGYGKVFLN